MSGKLKLHVLGAGSMGCLVSHEVVRSNPNGVELVMLFKNRSRYDDFIRHNSEYTVFSKFGENYLKNTSRMNGGCPETLLPSKDLRIENMILSTKTHQSEKAVSLYVKFMDKNSNLLILQNGMGVEASLREMFWPDEANCPNIYQAISTHGAYKTDPYTIHHAGMGKLFIAKNPRTQGDKDSLGSMEKCLMVDMLLGSSRLLASFLTHKKFVLLQMEKLVANSCINPLTAILDCFNGDLLYGDKIAALMIPVIREAVKVFKAEYADVYNSAEGRSFLDESRLLSSVLDICKLNSSNSSSMRQDMRHLNNTEIDSINGFITKLGDKHGISTPNNRMLTSMIKSKLSIERSLESKATSELKF